MPATVAEACLRLHDLGGSCDRWMTFAVIGRYNTFRHLKRRQLVVDANEPYRKGLGFSEIACQVYRPRWVLTEAGEAVARRKLAEQLVGIG